MYLEGRGYYRQWEPLERRSKARIILVSSGNHMKEITGARLMSVGRCGLA